MNNDLLIARLDQLIALLSRAVPPLPSPLDEDAADCFIWDAQCLTLHPVDQPNYTNICLIHSIDSVRDTLLENTKRFSQAFPAHHALLWGARGMGKSSLVKAIHAFINQGQPLKQKIKLIEINHEDIHSLPLLINKLKKSSYRFIIFCDDLSFSPKETAYKSLKTILDGSIEACPENILFYVTSNRRHLMPRFMSDTEPLDDRHPPEAIEEKVSLSERFGLWLGFHPCSQEDYLAIVKNYANYYGLEKESKTLEYDALQWSRLRGNRSGRIAWQFIQDLAGRVGKKLTKSSS